jgi:hypothetical protein
MNYNYKNILIYLATVTLFQVLAFLIDRSAGAAFLVSLALILGYELYRNTINPREAVTLVSGFLISGLAFAAVSKKLVYERLCQVSGSMTGTSSSILPAQETCLSIPEIWVQAITASPINTWYFWIATLGTSLLALKAYQEYSDRN